jgi:hypothetical protein
MAVSRLKIYLFKVAVPKTEVLEQPLLKII